MTGVQHDHRVAREEIFGPVLVAMPYDDLDEVAAWANDKLVRDGQQLIIGVDRIGPCRPVETALGAIGVRVVDGGAHRVQRNAVGGQPLHIGLHADRRFSGLDRMTSN